MKRSFFKVKYNNISNKTNDINNDINTNLALLYA